MLACDRGRIARVNTKAILAVAGQRYTRETVTIWGLARSSGAPRPPAELCRDLEAGVGKIFRERLNTQEAQAGQVAFAVPRHHRRRVEHPPDVGALSGDA